MNMAGLLSSETVERVRAASDIVEVIGGSLRLKRAGANFVGLCPFHKEKTPSFHVNPQRQIFHCFGCHKGGDVFTFVQEFEHLGFTEAIQRLAERAHIPLVYERGGEPSQGREVRDQLLLIHEQITQRWHNALLNEASGQAARDYLARRSVSDEAIRLFRLGSAPDAWDDTVNWARAKGFDVEQVEKAGLILPRDGGGHYDRFRGRLVFPINDEQGRVIGFSARVLDPEAKTAKYVNSPETPLFTKGRVIYGLDKSKRALIEAESAVVCEGQLDLIACFMAGIHNVVAPQGTALTADHARILKRYVDEVILCFDADAAGQQATVRALDELLASGLAVRVASIPPPHDPDSFIREFGGPALRQRLEQAVSFYDFYLDRLCRTNDLRSDRGRLEITREMAVALHKSGSPVLLDTYAQKTAQRLGVSVEAIRSEFRRGHRVERQRAAAPDQVPAPPAAERTLSPQEFWLIRLLLIHDGAEGFVRQHLDLAWLSNEVVKTVVDLCLRLHERGEWRGVADLLTRFEEPDRRRLISEAAAFDRQVPNPDQQLEDVVRRLRDQHLDRRLGELMQRLGAPELTDAAKRELLEEQVRLRHYRRQPLSALPDV